MVPPELITGRSKQAASFAGDGTIGLTGGDRSAVTSLLVQRAMAVSKSAENLESTLKRSRAFHRRGLERFARGDRAGAASDYTKAIELNPRYAQAYCNRGTLRKEAGDAAGAIRDFTKAVELKPDFSEAYYNRANLRHESGDFTGALSDYTKAIRVRPDIAEAYFGRGMVLLTLHRSEEAIRNFDRAVALRPKFPDAFTGRALAREVRGDRSGASQDLGRALSMALPDWPHRAKVEAKYRELAARKPAAASAAKPARVVKGAAPKGRKPTKS